MSVRLRGPWARWAALILATACSPPAPGGDASGDPDAPGPSTLGESAPARFGFGSPAPETLVARMDVDVKPNGEGLPPGSGSVARGRRVYEVHCVQCHGPTGAEGPNDRLVGAGPWERWPEGRTVGGYWPYATTLFDYTRRAMPQTTPGVLTDDEVYAVTGYVLSLSGLVDADAVMDSAALASIDMPYRDRFVPDDRRGGPEVR